MPTHNTLTPHTMFRGFLPVVEIKKVTLETSREMGSRYAGTTAKSNRWYEEKLRDTNPHIDPLTQNWSLVDRGKEAAKYRVGGLWEPQTRVVLDLAISVPPGSTILEMSDIRNALHIYVKITISPESYESALREVSLSPTYDWDLNSLLQGHTATDKTSPGNRISETLPDGRRVIAYPFRVDCILPESTIQNLGIVVWSGFDMTTLVGAIQSTLAPYTPTMSVEPLISQRSGLLALSNGRIVSKSQTYHLLNTNLWEGPVHYETVNQATIESKIGALQSQHIISYGMSDSEIEQRIKNLKTLLNVSRQNEGDGLWVTGFKPEPEFLGWTEDGEEEPRLWGINQIVLKSPNAIPRVQDFRTSMDIENLEFDFSYIENNALAAMKKDLRNEKLDIAIQESYFSDLFLSRDINDYSRFFFSVDWQRILVENSVFGKLFANRPGTPQLNRLLGESRIMMLRIYRHRVEGSSETGSTPLHLPAPPLTIPDYLKPRPFDENQIDPIIVETNDAVVSGELVEFALDRNLPASSASKGRDAAISEMMNLFQDPPPISRLRHFEGVDGAIADNTDGYYQYRIEFEILDKSIEIVDDMRQKLDEYIQGLEWYYREATKLERGGTPSVAPDGSPYVGGSIAGRTETIFQPGEIQTGNFNSKTNYFTTAFAQKYAPITNQGVAALIPRILPNDIALGDAISNTDGTGFVGILKFFSKASSNQDSNYWSRVEQSLRGYLNPWSGTPASINAVIRLMETVSNKLQSIIGVVRTQQRQEVNVENGVKFFLGGPEGTKEHIVSKNRTFKIVNTPSAIFNANIPSRLGFDFMGTTGGYQSPAPRNGLSMIDYSQFNNQVGEGTFFNAGYVATIPSNTAVFGNASPPPLKAIIAQQIHLIGFDSSYGTYFTPNNIFIPSEPFPININGGNFRNSDFLKPVPFSLYGSRTDEIFLSRLESGIPARTQTAIVSNNKIFANDLARYYSTYHSADVTSPADQAGYSQTYLDLERTWLPVSLESTPGDEGYGDSHYKTLRRESNKDRDDAYKILFKSLKDGIYDPSKRRKLAPVDSLMYSDYNYTDLNSKLGQTLDAAWKIALMSDPNLIQADWYLKTLRDAPPQIKFLLFQDPIFDFPDLQTAGSQAAIGTSRAFYNSVDADVTLYPEFMYRTQYINKCEYLSSYDTGLLKIPYDPRQTDDTLAGRPQGGVRFAGTNSPVNVVLMKSPVWQNTTQDINSKGSGKYLCKIFPYTNATLMIRRDKTYDLPTYDEHFILEVPTQ